MKAAYNNVLVVASNQDLAEGIGKSLELSDCRIRCCTSFPLALHTIENIFYHAVFVDTKMRDARQFLFKARHFSPYTSFICVTPETVSWPPNTVALNFQVHHMPVAK